MARDEKKSRWNILPDGSESLRRAGQETEQWQGRKRSTPLLPENINSAEYDGDAYLQYDGQYDMEEGMELVYDSNGEMSDNRLYFQDNDYESDNNWDGQEDEEEEEEEELQDMLISEEEAEASQSVYQRLLALSKSVNKGMLLTLKTEMVWALTVAEEILELAILNAGTLYSDNGECALWFVVD